MAGKQKLREGDGTTSEQRQRMSQPKRIHEGMVVRSRSGEPLGRVISVDDDGFVLEHRVVITREHRVRLDEVHAMEDGGVVLTYERTHPLHAEAKELTEVFWSARRARDEQKPLDDRAAPRTGASRRMVAVTEHAEAYTVQVERGTVRAPRYVPMSEEQFPQAAAPSAEPAYCSPRSPSETPENAPPQRPSRTPWSRGVRRLREGIVARYATRPLTTATTLLGRLRNAWSFSEH